MAQQVMDPVLLLLWCGVGLIPRTQEILHAGAWPKENIFRGSCCGTMGLAVSLQSWDAVSIPSWHSGLRIWGCHSCGIGCNCSSDLIPSLGTPYAMDSQKRKKKFKTLLNVPWETKSLWIEKH